MNHLVRPVILLASALAIAVSATGHAAPRWFGRCPGCGEWNTCAEEQLQVAEARWEQPTAPGAALRPITEVSGQDHERLRIGISEFDRVLGGGVMPGSVVLVGGDPGIGKSTLLLQMAAQLAAAGLKVERMSRFITSHFSVAASHRTL